jgi:prevent-host-death family protein
MTTVSVRELKTNLSEYLRRTSSGEQLTITSRGKPIAVLTPVSESDEQRLDRKLRELEAKGVLRVGIGKPKALHPRIKLRGKGPSVSEMVIEDRR